MKKLILLITLLFFSNGFLCSQVGINASNSAPDPSAGLDVNFTNKGLLMPRVALTAINSALPVTAPAVGLLVYNTAVAGTQPDNVMPGYYCWNGTRWIPVLPPQGANVGDMLYWNGMQWVSVPVGTNGQFLTLKNGVPAWGALTALCGMPLTIGHIAGTVAPVNKTVTYGTVANIPGEPSKCWITCNLGAGQQPVSMDDAGEAPAGWYWQFNRMQGYMHDGSNRTPDTEWISGIVENADWQPSNDPCTLELGAGWRIPTSAEWTNVDAAGDWSDWNGPWNSALKIHAAGYLHGSNGSLTGRGSNGTYWSSTQDGAANSLYLDFYYGGCIMYSNSKAFGFPVRCLRNAD
ncbi:MAG: hypothetical protein NT040_16165 [Bacteroidetes bacterium]|nr:hypothetical protein [Bacteroidota bacterium]